MKLLKSEQHKSDENTKVCYFLKETFEDQCAKDKKYPKVRYHCHYTGEYRGAVYSLYNLKYSIPNEIPNL